MAASQDGRGGGGCYNGLRSRVAGVLRVGVQASVSLPDTLGGSGVGGGTGELLAVASRRGNIFPLLDSF